MYREWLDGLLWTQDVDIYIYAGKIQSLGYLGENWTVGDRRG
jgi:hypothetical protein